MTKKIKWYTKECNGYQVLYTTTSHHFDVSFYFKGGEIEEVLIDGWEYPITEEMLNGLFVSVGDKMLTIVELSHMANSAYPSITNEVKTEDDAYDSMRRELSSPEATGRV